MGKRPHEEEQCRQSEWSNSEFINFKSGSISPLLFSLQRELATLAQKISSDRDFSTFLLVCMLSRVAQKSGF